MKSTGKSKKGKSAPDWRSRQLAPTPERYKEIQTALAKRGYLAAAPNGVWDASSAEALRHFQQEQNLEPTGKLNSLSLIALGLGAKRGNTVAQVPAAPPAMTPRAPAIDSPPALPQNAIPPSPAPNPGVPELPPVGPPPPASR
ncbi:MAG: peptidoglycan-binding protein [Acidobacteriia bacterium]|nr:peptidoglycan-binding protein [Terriglobia bacterium]